jgi:hypothetical protein
MFSDWRKAFRPSTLNSGYVTLTTKGFQFNRGRDTPPQKQQHPQVFQQKAATSSNKALSFQPPQFDTPEKIKDLSSSVSRNRPAKESPILS